MRSGMKGRVWFQHCGFSRLTCLRLVSRAAFCIRYRDEFLMLTKSSALYHNFGLGAAWNSRVSSERTSGDLTKLFGPFNLPDAPRSSAWVQERAATDLEELLASAFLKNSAKVRAAVLVGPNN